MASIFDEVALQWKGKEYIVPPDKVMGLVAVVEDVITIEEMSGKGVKRAKLATAFAAAIRYAAQCHGAFINVDEQEVYNSLFGAEFNVATNKMIMALLSFMIPPEHLQTKQPAKESAKKSTARRKKSATGSSRKPT